MEQGSNRRADAPDAGRLTAGAAAGATPAGDDARRHSGISINREGELVHEGEPVRHAGLRQALFRWLDRLPDGRHVFRLDAGRFVYLDVVDTPLVVRSAAVTGGGVRLGLSDGTTEELDPRTLTADDEGVLRCWVRAGRCQARLSTSAVAALAEDLSEAPGGRWNLRTARDGVIAIGHVPGP